MKRDAIELRGLAVHDVDGTKVGDVVDFYFDAATNEPEWLLVEAGILDHQQAFVPLADIQRDGDALKTPYPKDMILDAPEAGGAAIDRNTEQRLFEHFHIRRELPGRTEEEPAFEQGPGEEGDFRLKSWKASNAA